MVSETEKDEYEQKIYLLIGENEKLVELI